MTQSRDTSCEIATLCQRARDLGATEVRAFSAEEVVLDERTALKCRVPICNNYGLNLMCPPHVMSLREFAGALSRYHHAMLVRVEIPSAELGTGHDSGQDASPTPLRPGQTDVFRVAKQKLYDILYQIEALCLERGYHFAAGLGAGSCTLCDECVGPRSGLPCRHPFRARPSMEAVGIDVIATAQKAGLALSFEGKGGRSWVGLVLID